MVLVRYLISNDITEIVKINNEHFSVFLIISNSKSINNFYIIITYWLLVKFSYYT